LSVWLGLWQEGEPSVDGMPQTEVVSGRRNYRATTASSVLIGRLRPIPHEFNFWLKGVRWGVVNVRIVRA
jgi:hypothetical protein